ncbi:MAG: sigma-54-dependent transcriptional regulator [Thermodesulfobacteriota bacterium]
MSLRLFPANPVLLVDDEESALKSFDLALRSEGINHTVKISNARDVMPFVSQNPVTAILLDISMPEISGDKLLAELTEEYPHIPVIIITGHREVELAVECMKNNAFDYMVKPIENSRLVSGVKRAAELRRLYDENELLKQEAQWEDLTHPEAFSGLISRNSTMKNLFLYAESIAKSPHPLLITGETGVGKELMAKAVHYVADLPGDFVSVNVAGIDDSTFSDTLFGHVKGAFTGADNKREGLIEKAAGGTLFLDEIGDLKSESQIKLLRLLQEHEYFMLGSDVPRIMNTRIIAATNLNVKQRKESGVFRKDLYYRLSTHRIHLPPLRERLDDLPLLLDFFTKQAADACGKQKPSLPGELVTLLSGYDFPGNIRELQGLLHDAVRVVKSKTMPLDTFKEHIYGSGSREAEQPFSLNASAESPFENFIRLPTMAEAQVLLIKEALQRSGNNKSMAAQMLNISRQRLARHIKQD